MATGIMNTWFKYVNLSRSSASTDVLSPTTSSISSLTLYTWTVNYCTHTNMCYHSQLNLCSMSGCWISSPVVNESRVEVVSWPGAKQTRIPLSVMYSLWQYVMYMHAQNMMYTHAMHTHQQSKTGQTHRLELPCRYSSLSLRVTIVQC